MEPNLIWKRRWASDSLPILKKYMEVVCRKKSAVCLAADRYKMNDLFVQGRTTPNIQQGILSKNEKKEYDTKYIIYGVITS